MRLEKLQAFLKEKNWKMQYSEEDGCASIDFEYRGVPYHVWEFEENGVRGAETNVRSGGRYEDISGDYETEIIEIINSWS